MAETKPSQPERRQEPGTPDWVTPELIVHTRRVWQRYYNQPLTDEDAVEILLNVGNLLDALGTSDDEQHQRQTVPRVSTGQQPGAGA